MEDRSLPYGGNCGFLPGPDLRLTIWGKLWVSSLIEEALEFAWRRSLVGGLCRRGKFWSALFQESDLGTFWIRTWLGYRIPLRTLLPLLVLVKRLFLSGKSISGSITYLLTILHLLLI